jgi:hypothetical protein
MICIMNNARPIVALVYVLEVLRWLLNLPHLCRGRPSVYRFLALLPFGACGAGEGPGAFRVGVFASGRSLSAASVPEKMQY